MALCRDCRTVIPCHCHLTPPAKIRPGVYLAETDPPTPATTPEPPATYWENRGPRNWQPVHVVVRYGPVAGHRALDLPHLTTGKLGPRNVLIQRADGTADVVPVRNLRRKKPA